MPDFESSSHVSIPPCRESDPEDVAWGLRTAGALWKSGERIEAVVWLRRAALAASEAEHDHRALEVARSAADLSEWLARKPPLLPAAPSAALVRAQQRPLALPEDPRIAVPSDPDSQRTASFRLLRDNVLAKGARVIAISSAAEHEGKTTCAVNLAFAMCERRPARVLLVEGNFFAPSLHLLFRIDVRTPVVPASTYPALAPYRVVEVARGLHVAAIVPAVATPNRTWSSRWFERAIEHFSASPYDHVIIDAATLDGSPAVMHVASVADGTLFTARSGGTRTSTLRRAAALVPRDKVLGVVLMDGEL